MSISVGDRAPEFTLTMKNGEGLQRVSLEEARRGGNVVLLFFPMAFTRVCTAEFCDLTPALSQYAGLDAQVYGISGDNPFAQEAWAQKERIGVSLLSDYEHDVARAYGVAYESFLPEKGLPMGGVAKRSAFVIDRGGVVRYAEVHDNPGELPDFGKIQEVLAGLGG
jgi:glutaredoxin-dependent peroxiredoxin